jgi:hypothetical protein
MSSPSWKGLRAILRKPSLMAIEILWRFSFGACALLLAGTWILRFLTGLHPTEADVAALTGGNRDFAALALLHILQGTGPSIARAMIILIPALSLFWMLFATWGRVATLRNLFPAHSGAPVTNFFPILGLKFLRVLCLLLMVVAVFTALLGASYLSISISSQPGQPNLLIYFLIVLVTLPVIVGSWLAINWMLSIAPIFSVLGNLGTFSSISSASRAVRLHRGRFAAVSSAYGALRLFALLAVTAVTTIAALVAAAAGIKAVTAVVVFLTLAYYAFADILYVARFSAYIEVANSIPSSLAPSLPQVSAATVQK